MNTDSITLTSYGTSYQWFPLTDWTESIRVDVVNAVLDVLTIDNAEVVLGYQTASAWPDTQADRGSWTALDATKSRTTQGRTATGKVDLSTAMSTVFWVRFGVAVKSSSAGVGVARVHGRLDGLALRPYPGASAASAQLGSAPAMEHVPDAAPSLPTYTSGQSGRGVRGAHRPRPAGVPGGGGHAEQPIPGWNPQTIAAAPPRPHSGPPSRPPGGRDPAYPVVTRQFGRQAWGGLRPSPTDLILDKWQDRPLSPPTRNNFGRCIQLGYPMCDQGELRDQGECPPPMVRPSRIPHWVGTRNLNSSPGTGPALDRTALQFGGRFVSSMPHLVPDRFRFTLDERLFIQAAWTVLVENFDLVSYAKCVVENVTDQDRCLRDRIVSSVGLAWDDRGRAALLGHNGSLEANPTALDQYVCQGAFIAYSPAVARFSGVCGAEALGTGAFWGAFSPWRNCPGGVIGICRSTTKWTRAMTTFTKSRQPDERFAAIVSFAGGLFHELIHTCYDTVKDQPGVCERTYLANSAFIWAMMQRYPELGHVVPRCWDRATAGSTGNLEIMDDCLWGLPRAPSYPSCPAGVSTWTP